MATGAAKNAGQKQAAPTLPVRPTVPGTRPIATPAAPTPTPRADTALFSGQQVCQAEDDLTAKIAAVKKAQQAQGHEEGGDGEHAQDEHHGHNPGAVAGEGARSANHLSHGAKGLGSAAKEAEALKLAAKEAEALRAAAREAEALKLAAQEAQAAQKAAKAIRDVAKVAGAAEAAHEGAVHHAPGKLGKVLGGVGIAGGGLQVVSGISQIRNGETAEGVKNVVVGSGFAASGISELSLAAKVATKVAAPLAGAASTIEGGYDVVQGIRKGDGKKVALGSAKGIGGALLAASPFVTGSVVGAPLGIVMGIAGTTLIAGAAVVENWDTIKGWAKSGARAVGNAAGWVADKASGAASWVAGKASSMASGAWEGAKAVFSGW